MDCRPEARPLSVQAGGQVRKGHREREEAAALLEGCDGSGYKGLFG